jgi:osmotically-inducible protein OsmY
VPVHNRDGRSTRGEIGQVDHLLVDPESGEVSHLVIRRGLLSYFPVLSIDRVEEVSDEAVTVSLTDEKLRALPRYKRRNAEDIEAELRDQLQESAQTSSRLDFSGVEVSAEAGVVRLTGWVPSTAAKRRAEAIARSIEGVVDVQNELDTQATLTTRVQRALLSDPRTELSAIEVTNHQGGVITLKGRVDSAEVADAAQEIAAEQPGVLSVVNDLKVEPDEDTKLLNARLLSLTMLGERFR